MIAKHVQNQNTKINKITLQITQTCKQHKKTKINKSNTYEARIPTQTPDTTRTLTRQHH